MTLLNTYTPLDLTFTHGEGMSIWDNKGNEYLDALGGIAVTALGHAHPAVIEAIADQAAKLLHTSNLYHIENQEKLATRLTKLSELNGVFFSNSGAEANEAAIKLCRLFGHEKGIDNPAIIVMDHAFHGRTLATLTASASRKVQAGFEPLVQGFVRAPFNDIEALSAIAKNNTNVAAVFLEPIQGEGGIYLPDDNYLENVRALCDENDWLMVLDEIQTGVGRTGKFYAYQHTSIKPDIVTSAKALGNGIPIGATIAGKKANDLFQPAQHGSTFGGNPFSTRVALAVLDVLEKEHLIAKAAKQGDKLLKALQASLGELETVQAIRGKGLMIGVELNQPARPLLSVCAQNQLLVGTAGTNVIRLLPPYIVSDQDIEQIVARLTASLTVQL